MENRIRDILKRLRKIWASDSNAFGIDLWDYDFIPKIQIEYHIWIGARQKHFCFKSFEEIEEWLRKKELLLKKF